jgi:alanyl aminopeptidase
MGHNYGMRKLLPLLFCGPVLCAVLSAAEAPKLRLGSEIRPVNYAADLTLVPGSQTFAGKIEISITLAKPASLIWLNATGLTIKEASVTVSGKTQTAAIEPGGEDFVGLSVPAEIPSGTAVLHIEYQGTISPKNTEGIFQGTDNGEPYLFSQFESIDARRAFPCFDEPDFKTPWQLTLHVRRGDKAFANTAPVSETDEPNDMKRVVFAPTRPLPSYLVALAVGPFEVVDAGQTAHSHIPIRIVVPKGKTAQAKYAAEVTATIVDRLEQYFGIPYPYEKLDEVAVPLTFGFGAMENAGLITYAQSILLADPAIDTINRQREYASDAAHEIAHQWFGDLVTTAWWNDIWLNEAFATWMSSRIIADWQPAWESRLSDLRGKFGAMGSDSLVTARRIRQPIESKNDIANAFDGITYEKGAAVIRMFESWVGEKQFEAGVTTYLKRHAFGNATAGDFLNAIAAAGKPALTKAFSTFLDQAGIPEVSVKLLCDSAPRVLLSQKRYLPIGSSGSHDERWQVPVCVRYQTEAGAQSECFLLDRPSAEFPLSKAGSCPTGLAPNADAAGYYIASYDGPKASMSAAERLTFLHDLAALAGAGDARESTALQAAESSANDPERQISTEARGIVAGVRDLVPPTLAANYAAFIRKNFGPRAHELGWTAKPADDSEIRLLRASLVPFVAREGGDEELRKEARRLTDHWLETRQGIDPDMLSAVLSTAAFSGDQPLFDTLLRELEKTKDLHQRAVMIGALASFRDPKIVNESLNLLLDPELDVRESARLLFGPLGDRATEKMPFEFVKANYDPLLKRIPSGGGSDGGAFLPFVGTPLCDEPSRHEFVDFFQDRVQHSLGAPRNYAQVLEGIRLCEARRAAQAADVEQFFTSAH